MRMKKSKLLPVWLMLVVSTGTLAQMKTYLTLEAGPQWSILKVSDPGGYLRSTYVPSSIAGLTISQEILPGLSISSGLYFTRNRQGINLTDDRPHQSGWDLYTSLMIPFRASYRVQPTAYPFSFTPRMGYMYGMISPPDVLPATAGIISAPDGTILNYNMTSEYASENLHMLEVGMGFNLRFSGLWQASVNLSYLTGFTEPFTAPLNYTGAGAGITPAAYSTRGNSLFTTLAFDIPVSNIWQNKDYRIRSRIENAVYEGKPTDKKGLLYVGGEIGSLWRLFNTTNPAIGGRPMEKRGVIRYANLHTGIYAGLMVSDELGIDAGVNYQRSSTFYAIMYDHEVDFVVKTPAPFYLEIPLRVRYFYPLQKKKLYYVVYGGASLLTHFSMGTHGQGSGGFTLGLPETGTPADAVTTYTATRVRTMAPALRLGTGVEYSLPLQFPLIATLNLNYMHGFISINEIRVTHTLPDAPALSSIRYNGTGWSIDLGVKIPFRPGTKRICEPLPEKTE